MKCWGGGELCDGLAFHPRGSNDTPGHFILRRREWPSGQSAGLWAGRPGFKSWMGHYVVALSKSLHSPCFVFSDKT